MSKFKASSHDIFFSETYDLFPNSARHLLFGVYFSPHERDIVCEYKLRSFLTCPIHFKLGKYLIIKCNYYFIFKCNLFIKILQRGKNTKNMKIWTLYKIINFRKFSGASNKIATAGLPRAAEPWKLLRICQININWKSQKQIPHQFILSEILSGKWK